MRDHSEDGPLHDDSRGDDIERVRPLVVELCREVEPAVQVLLMPYRWPDGDMVDIALRLGGEVRHVEVPAGRLLEAEWEPQLVRADIERAVADLRRAADEHGAQGPGHDPGASSDAGLAAHPLTSTEAVRAPSAAAPLGSPAHGSAATPPVASPLPLPDTSPQAEGGGQPIAPLLTRDTPDTGHLPRAETTADVDAEDRSALDQTMRLARHVVAELEPAATVAFEEYPWHGELTLDICVSLRGHDHHYEITASRARLLVLDHHMLEHDLEGIVADLRREAHALHG